MERIENTVAFMEKCRVLLEQGETVTLPVQGNSMAPFLVHRRDTVTVAKPTGKRKVGDIVLYQRAGGAYILHRICAVRGDSYTLIGDAHTVREYGVRQEQIFGIVTEISRKGSAEKPGTFWWEFFSRIWVRIIPLRPTAVGIYSTWMKCSGRRKGL